MNKIQKTYWKCYHKINHVWRWFLAHTFRREHILDIRCKTYKDYSWGYVDKDRKLFLACFKLLEQFIEQEDPETGLLTVEQYGGLHGVGREDEDELLLAQISEEKQLREIYNWWKYQRPLDWLSLEGMRERYYANYREGTLLLERDLNQYFNRIETPEEELAFKYLINLETKLEQNDDEMLMKLIKLRRRLWS